MDLGPGGDPSAPGKPEGGRADRATSGVPEIPFTDGFCRDGHFVISHTYWRHRIDAASSSAPLVAYSVTAPVAAHKESVFQGVMAPGAAISALLQFSSNDLACKIKQVARVDL